MKRLSIALILLAAASGRLSAQVSVTPPVFGTVRAGETAKIEWRGLPRQVAELELLLTIEGRELPVRVTPQLAARAGVLLWRVPNLPSRRARLTIRYGLDGEETENAPSAPFEILPAAGEPPAVLAFREGEWWTQECAQDQFPGALNSREDGDRMQENREGPPCAGSRDPGPAPEQTASRAVRSETSPRVASSARPVLPRRPTEVPARI
ncbi:MAG TPA: hypothetical protein VGK70_08100 [Thermoanaerobaculia bacterium]